MAVNQKFYEITGRTEEPNEMHRLSMRLAELEREKVRDRRQTITCYNCGKTGHTKRDCRQQRQNNVTTCNYCNKRGHNENECWTKQNRMGYNNNNAQGRNNNQNMRTREINFVDYEDYEEYNDDQEVYITTRSGKKYDNPTPKIITPRETTPRRRTQPMNIDNQGAKVKRTLGQSKMERMTPEVDIVNVLNNTPANITVAQLMRNSTYRKEIAAALRRHQLEELQYEEEQNNH